MSPLKAFLEDVENIRLDEIKNASIPLPECEAYASEVLTGISLIEKKRKFFLVIYEDNRRYEIEWPGTEEDFEAMKKEFKFLPFKMPYVMVRVLRLLKELQET